jgi:hypothetical protein
LVAFAFSGAFSAGAVASALAAGAGAAGAGAAAAGFAGIYYCVEQEESARNADTEPMVASANTFFITTSVKNELPLNC